MKSKSPPILPNTFLIGTPKAGTTALYKMLQRHPQVDAPHRKKEPRYFTQLDDTVAGDIPITGPRRHVRYNPPTHPYIRKLYKQQDPAPIRLDGSTFYFASDDAARKIAREVDYPKFVLGLRDPAIRIYSHYWYETKLGNRLPPISRESLDRGGELEFYTYTSRYTIHLHRWLQEFSTHQFFLYDFELFRKNPLAVLNPLCDFLTIERLPEIVGEAQNYNPSGRPRMRQLQRILYSAQYVRAGRLLPDVIRRRLGRARSRVSIWNTRPMDNPPLPEDVKAFLQTTLACDNNLYGQVQQFGATELPNLLSQSPRAMREALTS